MLVFREYRQGISGGLRERLEERFRTIPQTVLINFGCSTGEVGDAIVLNRPEAVRCAVDKPLALGLLLKRLSPDVATVPMVLALPEQAILKRVNHKGGRGCRLLTGSYVEEFVPCLREWRVYTIGKRTCARLKSGGDGPIRNYRYGWRFLISDESCPPQVRQAAVVAVASLDLHFGAVDVGERSGAVPVVYEVNTAPHLTADSSLGWWFSRLERLVLKEVSQ